MDFPNYAGRSDKDAEIRAELEAAGIEVHSFEFFRDQGEVKTAIRGSLQNWGFKRAWYYWVATGSGLPPEYAVKLHESHGQDVRVEGHCGCPHPLEYNKGFGVGLYHVDSWEGLKALADALNQCAKDAQEKYEKNIFADELRYTECL